jgi:hypothetical protein
LSNKSNEQLCDYMMKEFPKVFCFERCGVLFQDRKSSNLFRFTVRASKKGEEVSINTYPNNIGCTGVSIETDKIIYFNEG